MASRTCIGVQSEWALNITAAAPLTNGADKDVPLPVRYESLLAFTPHVDTPRAHKQHEQRPPGHNIGACANQTQIGRFGENLPFESTFLDGQTLKGPLKQIRYHIEVYHQIAATFFF